MSNKIVETYTEEKTRNPQMGDILYNPDFGDDFYILMQTESKSWAAISLKDGATWNGINASKGDAVVGLKFWGRNVKIKLEKEEHYGKHF